MVIICNDITIENVVHILTNLKLLCDVRILLTKCAVKCPRSARTNTIFIHRIYYIIFNWFVADEIKIVVSCKIYTRLAINYDIMCSLATTMKNKQKQNLVNIIHIKNIKYNAIHNNDYNFGRYTSVCV